MSRSVLVKLTACDEPQFECSSCGAPGHATCDCGVALVPREKALEGIKATPQLSNRAIAKRIGVDKKTVARARGDMSPPEKVTGQDGKSYPATKPPSPRLQKSMEKHGWYQRAELAAQEAKYAPLDTCPRDAKMKKVARAAIAAWTEVLNAIEQPND